MEVKNAVMPNETQLKEFNQQGEDKPIFNHEDSPLSKPPKE